MDQVSSDKWSRTLEMMFETGPALQVTSISSHLNVSLKNCHDKSPTPPEFQRTFAQICYQTPSFAFCTEEILSHLNLQKKHALSKKIWFVCKQLPCHALCWSSRMHISFGTETLYVLSKVSSLGQLMQQGLHINQFPSLQSTWIHAQFVS